ncbi:beta-ketoacyl synthase chain length factor [Terasakiella sp.]|uniref:beta-ketoacyl synthase chain length factor n=1 Tax=Terasakiella sp. TaxID=2034861 RepID=UPI003AA80FF0
MPAAFNVSNWSAWGPGLETYQKWMSSQDLSETLKKNDDVPDVKDLPMMLRRRLSRLGRMVMRVTHDLDDIKNIPMVFSSRYGESAQTVKMLQSLSQKEPISPAHFSMSVHNGLAGLFSITSKNIQAHTAVSAGPASFCNALLEAGTMSQLNPETPVLLVHYDELLPDFYEGFSDETVKPMAMALVIRQNASEQISYSVSKTDGNRSKEDAALNFMDGFLKKKKSWFWSDGRTQWNYHHVK